MAVPDQTPLNTHIAAGASGVFAYSFQIAAATDLAVTNDGAALTLNVDYTVTGVGVETGGTIIITPTPTAGAVVTVYRDTQLERVDDFQTAGDLPAAQVNLELDRLWRALQEIFGGGKGAPTAVRVPAGEVIPALPKASDRASRVLAFNSSGNPVVIAGVDSGSAAALALDLANTASATKGPALLGYNEQLAYAANTGGKALQRAYCPLNAPWLAKGDGATDDTAALAAFFSWLPSNSVADLAGKRYAVYNSVAGVTTGDAIALGAMLRLASKSNITIRNGSIFAASPSVSGVQKRFPSTLAIDGCTNITLLGVNLAAKGELWGDSDASLPLSADQRRAFLAQNGGHALVVTRSQGVYGLNCKFLLAGSVASFYSASSHDVALTACYASPQSLGYAAYAADSWCGAVAVSGFPRHEMVLNNCRTDNNGATYGSKGGLFAEDADVTVRVFGGVWADSYANGSSNFIGAAFTSVNASVYVNNAQVRNCAAIGLTYHSAAGDSILECTGVVASGLRTSMHINGDNSFGNSYVRYHGCYARYSASPSLWGAAELSQLTIVANMKVTSVFRIDLLDCDVSGAKYGSWNTRACYGGIRVFDGRYEVEDQFFKSLGWGGAATGTKRGFEVLGGARISVTSASATSAINDVTNLDGSGVSTYLYVDMDESVSIDSAKYRNAENFADTTGGTLTDRLRTLAKLIGCGSTNAATGPSSFKVISKDGVFGSNYRLTVSYPNNRPALGVAFDDVQAVRAGLSYQTAVSVGASVTQAQINVSGTGTSWTVGTTYPQIAN